MHEDEFRRKFSELVQRINECPPDQRARLNELAAETQRRHEETQEAVGKAQTAIQRLMISLQLALLKA